MVVWHYQLKGHEFQQAPGGGEGQGSLVCYSPWGHKESDTTEPLNNKKAESGKKVENINRSVISNETELGPTETIQAVYDLGFKRGLQKGKMS